MESIAFTQESIHPINDSSILDVGLMESETRDYFVHVEKLLEDQEFETIQGSPQLIWMQLSWLDQQLFIQNVYAEVDGKELLIASDYETSRILEKLLRASTDFQIRVFADRLNGQ